MASNWAASATENFFQTPLLTRVVVIVCVCAHLILAATGKSAELFCLHFWDVVKQYELYRLLTHAFFHWGLLHLLANMLQWSRSASVVESQCGTLPLLYTVLVSSLFTGVVSMLMAALALFFVPNHASFFISSCTAGISGVLFTLMVVEARLSQQASPSSTQKAFLLGIVPLSPHALPWVSLLVFQLIIPNASFLGHLTGLICGYGVSLVQPSAQWFSDMDNAFLPSLQPLGAVFSSPDSVAATSTHHSLPQWVSVLPNIRSYFSLFRNDQNVGNGGDGGGENAELEREQQQHLQDGMRVLMEMGFDRHDALEALRLSHMNVDRAIAHLTQAQ